jgi:hypothetical protein
VCSSTLVELSSDVLSELSVLSDEPWEVLPEVFSDEKSSLDEPPSPPAQPLNANIIAKRNAERYFFIRFLLGFYAIFYLL